MAGSYRWQRCSVALGLLGVALGSLSYAAAVWANAPADQVDAWVTSGATAFLAYGVLAAAAWLLMARLDRSSPRDGKLQAVVGLFAVGSALLCVGKTAELINFVDREISWSLSDHTQMALLGNFVLPAIGMFAVTVGLLGVAVVERRKPTEATESDRPLADVSR